jgi:addiction module RelB/DinJ family antitoxin
MATATIHATADPETGRRADELFASLGMDTPAAIRLFPNRAVRTGAPPFHLDQGDHNPTTQAATAEADAIIRGEQPATAHPDSRAHRQAIGA